MWFKKNLKNDITSESFWVRSSNFQNFPFLMMSNTGKNYKQICEVRVSIFQDSGWFDIELPFEQTLNKSIEISFYKNNFILVTKL